MSGQWRLDARSDVAGWLPVPARPDDAHAWVAARREEIAAAWGPLDPERSDAVTALLRGALERRPVDAAFSFQLWPVPAPLVAQVDVWFGAAPETLPDRADDVRPYDAAGLGAGIIRTRALEDVATGITLVGTDIVFAAGEAVVVVSFEPTIPELHGMLSSQFHAFVQGLVFTGPDGAQVRATRTPGFLDDAADAEWPLDVVVR